MVNSALIQVQNLRETLVVQPSLLALKCVKSVIAHFAERLKRFRYLFDPIQDKTLTIDSCHQRLFLFGARKCS